MLDLHCGEGFFSLVAASGGYPQGAVHGLLIAVASLVTAPRLQSTGSVVVALGLSCSVCGIFPDQGLNLCLLHWLADSLPLSHQEALGPTFYISKLR